MTFCRNPFDVDSHAVCPIFLIHLDPLSLLRALSNKKSFSLQRLYAKALYDNIADTTDELAFRRGDILTVIEQNTSGLDGWWLCTLRGRQVGKYLTLANFGVIYYIY